jgi:hypothetical protein
MGVEHIDRAGDPRVAGYRGLRDGELLRARGLFVAEGRQIVRRVVEDARYRVQSVLLNAAALRDLEPVIAGCDRDVPIFLGGASWPTSPATMCTAGVCDDATMDELLRRCGCW